MPDKSLLDYMPAIQFQKTHVLARIPMKNNPSDTGFDVTAVETVIIPARGSAVIPIGLKVAYIPPGYWFKVEGRSGLGFKHNLLPHPGIIDSEYRGDCGVKLYNLSDVEYTLNAGDRCAQFIFYTNLDIQIELTDKIQETSRSDKGFGSSGK